MCPPLLTTGIQIDHMEIYYEISFSETTDVSGSNLSWLVAGPVQR
jgi:hypothetical protein